MGPRRELIEFVTEIELPILSVSTANHGPGLVSECAATTAASTLRRQPQAFARDTARDLFRLCKNVRFDLGDFGALAAAIGFACATTGAADADPAAPAPRGGGSSTAASAAAGSAPAPALGSVPDGWGATDGDLGAGELSAVLAACLGGRSSGERLYSGRLPVSSLSGVAASTVDAEPLPVEEEASPGLSRTGVSREGSGIARGVA